MTQVSAWDLGALRRSMQGTVLTPADLGYDDARRVFNGNIDKHPALIARCSNAQDVARAVTFARRHELALAVRGGAHSAAGFATCQGGLVVDLSPMNGVEVDAGRRTASAGGGALWRDLDPATQAHGLAVPGGRVGHTGVGGLTLGGGIGWLTRTHGLTCDNLIAADLVTADGQIVQATAAATPDLFWALRGGGGNFGVVTRFEFALHPVGPVVTAGAMVYPPERGAEVLSAWEEFRKQAPEELNTMVYMQRTAHWEMYPEEVRGREAYILSSCSLLGLDETRAVLAPMRELQPRFELFGPMPYTALQTLTDNDFPFGSRTYARGHRLATLGAGAIEVIVDYCRRRPKTGSRMYVEHMEGAVRRLGEEDTAFPDRCSPYSIAILGYMRNDAEVATVRAWTREFWSDLKPHATGASYLNWLGVEEESGRVEVTFGLEKHRKLAAIKRRWDPENRFRLNPNIEPAPTSPAC